MQQLKQAEIFPEKLIKGQREAFARDINRLQSKKNNFINVACPTCGSKEYSFGFEKYEFTWVDCNKCLTLFMNPRPTIEILSEHYSNSENYRFVIEHLYPATEDSRTDKLHRPRYEKILGFCKQYGVKTGTVVEVGSGFGTFCKIAHEAGDFKNVIGIEPAPEHMPRYEKMGVKVLNKFIENVQLSELGSVDVAVSFEVIEHLFSPQTYIEQCHRILRPGGLLVLTCPNGKGFEIDVLRREAPAVDPFHINLMNPKSLSILMERIGFETLETTTPGRLDIERLRTAVLEGRFNIENDRFLKRIVLDEWDKLAWPFQEFIAENGLAAHMWIVCRKK